MVTTFNRRSYKTIRKKLRNSATRPEIILWNKLKDKQLKEYKFRRQQGIGPYIVDFYCSRLKLAIEVDGDSHFLNDQVIARDKKRQNWIEAHGVKIMRFQNHEVLTNIEGVLETIMRFLPDR